MQTGLEFWAPHVAALEQESVATAVYAKRHGLALHSLYYWRHKIKAAGAQVRSSPDRGNTFVALRVEEPVIAQQPGGCKLTLGAGVCVELPRFAHERFVAALLLLRYVSAERLAGIHFFNGALPYKLL